MLFFTPIYLFIFFPLVFYFYYNFGSSKVNRKVFLILFSLFFYSYWEIKFLPIIIFSIIINFFFHKLLVFSNINKKLLLWIGITINLLILIIFKYSNFIIDNYNYFFKSDIESLKIAFPLAISFFTFQSIVFLVNCYDKEINDVKFIDYSLFISFFPQLVAGPIVKFNDMVPQFNNNLLSKFKPTYFYLGLTIFLIGFIKKIFLADSLGIFVDESYSDIKNLSFLKSWILSISFTFQFYFDFSGYVDMAVGSALMLNIRLLQNFNSPLKSTSIIDFWHKWHITLSNFITNYVFTPWIMSFKKINFIKTMFVLFLVFLLAGLWHGPSWTFVIFGMMHGLALIINHAYKKKFPYKINSFLSWFLTFNFVNISFLMFRSESIADFLIILGKMFTFGNSYSVNNINSDISIFNSSILLLSFAVCFCFKNSNYLIDKLLDSHSMV